MVDWNYDWPLVSTLVERWQSESHHIFHMSCGKMMMIILNDVAYQMGLNIDEDPISGCIDLRGMLFPDASDSRLHMRWLPLLEDLDCYGQLSWDSANLAQLYHQRCRATDYRQPNLGRCKWLLQSWAYISSHPELPAF
ncbi:serine/threonine-protein phosphatase 7 long form homolog [Arachis ipaensis]|uniref:Aminotransferase-like plant mobile domain-containing protein n=1 Tax=Arachis hypogaea TaxID=3818 RepID=A0A444YCC3_ARAHY|nr:serine/threonine-protein phosphatase 7 long form homolog [Arachis ipaensis]XP_025664499.1 serine/threonine-protein phosphatase 7 long form homolog [Arachis hypogaea]RYQ99577.1 hypothetical protein Ahy_B07g087522 [Arachis hypogaea]